METSQRSDALAAKAWLLLLLACPAAAEMGDFTKGLQEGSVPLAEAVLVLGCALTVLSVLLLLGALLELMGKTLMTRCCGYLSYSIAHLVLATLWMPVVGISIYLITVKHYPAVAFVAAGAVFMAAHGALAVRQLCWCCCCAGAFMGTSVENPKSALLKSQSGDTGPAGRADSPTGGTASCDQFNPVAGVHGVMGAPGGAAGGVESHNPFHATYGLLPGSSVFAYQIFIPGSDEQQPGGRWGPPSSSRQNSPGSEGRQQARTSAQPLVQLQSARTRQ